MDFLRCGRIAVLVLCAVPLWGADEYSVKAAFVYNFTKYVDWPAASFTDAQEPLDICVYGEGPFGQAIEAAVAGKTSAGRALEVRSIFSAREASDCQVLVFAQDQKQEAMLSSIRGASVLTVGESEDFLHLGGIVRLKLDGGRVRMVIDLKGAERSHLRISSRLLSLAEVLK